MHLLIVNHPLEILGGRSTKQTKIAAEVHKDSKLALGRAGSRSGAPVLQGKHSTEKSILHLWGATEAKATCGNWGWGPGAMRGEAGPGLLFLFVFLP